MKGLYAAIVFCLLSLCGQAFAQDATYRIQPEDVLKILIYNEAQVNADIPVGRDGNISAPFVGIIHAAGKTTDELSAELATEYVKKLRLRDPRVSVTILQYRSLRASVGGAVNHPATVGIRPGDTLLTLLNNGGGPIAGIADLRHATFRRVNSRELIPIDLYAMLHQGDTSQNYQLQDGDELTVPEETNDRIFVLGIVQQPGVYPYREPMRLSDAIAAARGEVPIRSKLSETLVLRPLLGQPGQYVRIKTNFVRFLTKGDASQNIELQRGDIVVVPGTKTPDVNYISGLVNSAFILNQFGSTFFGLHIFGRR